MFSGIKQSAECFPSVELNKIIAECVTVFHEFGIDLSYTPENNPLYKNLGVEMLEFMGSRAPEINLPKRDVGLTAERIEELTEKCAEIFRRHSVPIDCKEELNMLRVAIRKNIDLFGIKLPPFKTRCAEKVK